MFPNWPPPSEDETPPPGATKRAITEAQQLAMTWDFDSGIIRDIMIASSASSEDIVKAVRDHHAACREWFLDNFGWTPHPFGRREGE